MALEHSDTETRPHLHMMPKICENVISSLSGSRMLTYPHIAGEPRDTKCEKELVCCPGNARPIQHIHHSGHCEQK